MAIDFTIERNGRTFFAHADGGDRFFVGYQTSYHDKSANTDFEGLYNVPTRALPKLVYAAADAAPASGFWADFIAPTARCEGGNYLTLNTYDRARFTWGFGQFAAHVPDGDFVLFFRDLLGRPEAGDYFPDLRVAGERICKVTAGQTAPLESDTSTALLMDYLNPNSGAIEDAEVLAAARLIRWTTAVQAARSLQVTHMINVFKRNLAAADRHLGLDGKPADVCCVVCDILHQGRAKYPAMQAALLAAKPLDALLKLGSISYPARVATLRAAINAAPSFAGKTWSRAGGDFVQG